jgi:uncharacterized protein (DUF2062 family)
MDDLKQDRQTRPSGAVASDGKNGGDIIKRKSVRELIRRVLLSDDSPQQIAFGVAIGVYLACSPFLGFHTVAALTLALIFRVSRLAAVLGTLINNPFTMAFLYLFELKVGSHLLGLHLKLPEHVWKNPVGLFSLGEKAFLSIIVGFLVVGLFASIVAFPISFAAARFFKARHARRKR